MNEVGLAVVVRLKTFIKAEIEKLRAVANTGGCSLDRFLASWSKFTRESINFHLCVYLQVLPKTFKIIS